MSRLVVWGAGELGGRVAALHVASGGDAVGCTASDTRHGDLRAAGVVPRRGEPLALLGPDDTLLLALPGSVAQGEAVGRLTAEGVRPPRRALLISSTGYYGTPSGPVDEQTPAGPGQRAAGIAAVEARFRGWAGERGTILRVGGLYRRGRGPFAALGRRGYPPLGPPDRALALIHYDDAATATAAAARREQLEEVYLLVVTPCPSRRAFYEAACVILGLEAPIFEMPTGRAPAEFAPARAKRDLLPSPAHPDWRGALVP